MSFDPSMRDPKLRTIVDILRKGNQELFHSSIIAWLLDPTAEHGYGPAFLDAFAQVVEERGEPRFKAALKDRLDIRVTTETAARKSRYDIRLEVGGTAVVIENKTKSLGDDTQFEKYQADNSVLVPLGLCELSFSEKVKCKYPLVTYADVLAMLDRLPDAPASDFRVLAEHYRRFLKRELAVLSEIDLWYSTGNPVHGARILELVETVGTYTENDRRYLNLYLLEHLRRDLAKSPKWKHCEPKINKDQQSGVWLALFGLEKEAQVFCFGECLAALRQEQGASIWLHVELWGGVLAKDGENKAGVLQLRCDAKAGKAFADAFRRVRPLRDGENYPARMKRDAGTFYLLARPLQKRHLTARGLMEEMDEFAGSLGTFV